MKDGLIIKLIGGLYTVMDGLGHKYNVKARGKFRHINISPKVGDYVLFDDDYILEIKDRVNDLTRPPICNIDQAILINSCKEPNFSSNLLDRFLAIIEFNDIIPIIVLTKTDLMNEIEYKKLLKTLNYYKKYYDVYMISSKNLNGISDLKKIFQNKVSVFAGQTGAGKSSLLNAIDNNLRLETGEISKALGRGRHTTRYTELIEVESGLIADTPGFSKLDFYDMTVEDLSHSYIDFFEYSAYCKFRGCLHINEPRCKVKEEVKKGNILEERYKNYLLLHEEIKNIKPKYYKE